MKWLLALVALVAACDDAKPPLTDCAGDLRGVWRVAGSSASGEARRFQIIAGPWSWEVYPMFDDGLVDGPMQDGVLAAPSTIDVHRFGGPAATLFGVWSRRYDRRNQRCRVQRLAVITQCHGDAFTMIATPPPPPEVIATCAPGAEPAAITWRFVRD